MYGILARLVPEEKPSVDIGGWLVGTVMNVALLLIMVAVLAPLFIQSVESIPLYSEYLGEADLVSIAVLVTILFLITRGISEIVDRSL